MGLYLTKNLCRAKETFNKMKKQPIEWAKIFESHISVWIGVHTQNIERTDKTQ